ncbi:macro domain-containing protein [Metabacillus halosaccharovorans]|uniref:macro domain-containing protein n=1 Tax=Metabacillus halosaccharovorans TaxID=930124 RepID=UPI00403D9A15
MFKSIKFSIMSKEFILKVLTTFLAIFGAITALLKPLSTYFPQYTSLGFTGMGYQLGISILIAIIVNFPRWKFSYNLSAPNSKVSIKIGDLLEEKGHLVIGINDVFDTEIGEVIKENSIQGQFLSRIYNSNQALLDKDIEDALSSRNISPIIDMDKIRGKNSRYPIGTTISLGSGKNKYFLTAYSYMGKDLKAQSSIDNLWHSLNNLWEEIRVKGQGTKVSMGILGAGLARIPSARKDILIKLIILSFVAASKIEFITDELTIVIHESDLQYINMVELKNTLNKLCY